VELKLVTGAAKTTWFGWQLAEEEEDEEDDSHTEDVF
jgi:hypothetical protein